MLELSRRSFLKGILAVASSAAIPIELIKVIEDNLPQLERREGIPGYIKINGLLVPVYSIGVTMPLPAKVAIANKWTLWEPPNFDELDFTSTMDLSHFFSHEIVWAIDDPELPFGLSGRDGRFTYKEFAPSSGPACYSYGISCIVNRYPN